MNRELVLVGVALSVLVVAAAGAIAAGVIDDPTDEEAEIEEPGMAAIEEVTISAEEVTGGTASLAVDTYLDHRGNPVENVTVVHRATDTETGLVEYTTERDAPTLENESEYVVSNTVEVPRESSYRIDTFLYVDGERERSVNQQLEGVESLTPAYADTDLQFLSYGEEFAAGSIPSDLPAIEYTIASATDEQVTLEVATSLTNTGDDSETDVDLEVTARQSDSHVVADRERISLERIDPGETERAIVELDVPEGYDYYLDATLWRGDTVVGADRGVANLGPGNLTVTETDEVTGLQVGDFAESPDDEPFAEDDVADRPEMDEEADDDAPGFGILVSALTLLAIAVVVRRYTND